MADGIDCKCFSRSEGECSCGADWTPNVVYMLQEEISTLKAQLAEAESKIQSLLRGEYICSKCGMRKDADSAKPDF